MGSPAIWGPNNTATNLQNQILQSNGSLLAYNGPKNYISYNSFENNATTGWSLGTVTLTSNFPSGVPTFGSGASGNLSIATVSSGQLAGLYSMSYVSSAATTAGNFVASQAYTIDIEDQAKVLGFRFAFQAQTGAANCNFSGTSSNSFGVAIYDVTNSAWIMPAGVFNLTQSSGVGIATGTFQTPSNMTQFRIVLYNANATSGAATLYLDDFFVGPQVSPLAPVMSDFQTASGLTPNNFGTVSANTYQYRRVGDSYEAYMTFNAGTLAGATASITLPFAMDSTKLPSNTYGTVVGTYLRGQTSGASQNLYGTFSGVIFYDGSDTSKLYFAQQINSSGLLNKDTATNLFNSNQPVSVHFLVPIAGWSSNAVSSADTDSRIAIAQASGSATGGSGAGVALVFPTLQFDTHAAYSNSTGAYTAPIPGYYRATCAINASATVSIYVYVNGVQKTLIGQSVGSEVMGSGVVKVNAGDAITVAPGASLGALGTGYITFERISGPAVVQASETVAAAYYASTTFTASSASANFDTKIYDTHAAVTASPAGTGTWKFTAPITGFYRVAAILSGGVAGASAVQLFLYKNGSAYAFIGGTSNLGSQDCLAGTGTVQLNAGDTCDVRANGTLTYDGGTQGTAACSTIFIERVK